MNQTVKDREETQVSDDGVAFAQIESAEDFCSVEVSLSAALEAAVFETLPVRRCYGQIRLPVVLRAMGLWFAAASGEGKSKAIDYCLRAIRQEFPGLPTYTLNLHILPSNASRSIPFRMLADIFGVRAITDSTKMRLMLARGLAELARLHPARLVVLLLDESQALREQDLFFFKDLSNDLAREGIGLLVVCFGESPKMEQLVDKSLSDGHGGLAERFFARQLVLPPYTSLEDIQSLLREMDSMPFDVLKGKTIPEAMLTGSDGTKHLLERESTELLEAINVARTRGRVSLRRIFLAIRWWILDSFRELQKAEQLTSGRWQAAVDYAAFSG